MKKIPDIVLMLVLIAASVTISFTSPQNNKSKQSSTGNSFPEIPNSLLQTGDIIFRDGRGFISAAFKRLSLKDPKYSHVGIIHIEGGRIFVYHIIDGGHNSSNCVRKDLLETFCTHLQANAFAIYRTNLDPGRIDSLAGRFYDQKIKFDSQFDIGSDDKMYCTEYVYKILQKVAGVENYLPLTTLSGFDYISCDDIYLSPHTKKVYSFSYTSSK